MKRVGDPEQIPQCESENHMNNWVSRFGYEVFDELIGYSF